MEKKWHVDPKPKIRWEEDYKVWIYNNHLIEHLNWDPLQYHWNIHNQKKKQFFAYTMGIGRPLLLKKLVAKTLIKNLWASHKVHDSLGRFWEKLWIIDLPNNEVIFLAT